MLNIPYIILGSIALALGAIGAVLPLLPTTPFVLLAAYFFSKGSPRLHSWLRNLRYFGPMVREWEAHGVIRPRAKWLATTMMLLLVSYPLLFKPIPLPLKLTVVATIVFALWFIWSRPSHPPQTQELSNGNDLKPERQVMQECSDDVRERCS